MRLTGVGGHRYNRLAAALLSTLTGLGLPGLAAASEVTSTSINAKKGDSGESNLTETTVTRFGDRFVVETGTVKDGRAFNAFSEFKVKAGHEANLRLPESTKQLINLVYDQAVVNGDLRSLLHNGEVGGDVIFATRGGFIVGAEGSLNVGGLAVATPEAAFMDGFFDGDGVLQADQVRDLLSGQFEVDAGSEINIQGEIEADHAVRLRAGKVTVGGEITVSDPDASGFDASVSDLEAEALFTQAVNLDGLQAGGAVATHNGDIVIGSERGTTVEAGARLATAAEGGAVLITASGTVEAASHIDNDADIDSPDDIEIVGADTVVAEGAVVEARAGGTIAVRADRGQVRVDGRLDTSRADAGDGGGIVVAGTGAAGGTADDAATVADESANTVIGASAVLDASAVAGSGGTIIIGDAQADTPIPFVSERVSLAGTVNATGAGGGARGGRVRVAAIADAGFEAGSVIDVSASAAGTADTVTAGKVTVASGGDLTVAGTDAAGRAGAVIRSGVSAHRAGNAGGSVRLDAAERLTIGEGARLIADNGEIALDSALGEAPVVEIAGELSATGAAPGDAGGRIDVFGGDRVRLAASALLDVSGHADGGDGGTIEVRSIGAVDAETGAILRADSGLTGNGGRIDLGGVGETNLATGRISAASQNADDGQVLIDKSTNITIGGAGSQLRYDTNGADLELTAWDTITLQKDAVINTRETDQDSGAIRDTQELLSTGDSGHVTLEAREIILEGEGEDGTSGRLVGARILTWADDGKEAGDVTLKAIRRRSTSQLTDAGVDITIEHGARIDTLAFSDDRVDASPEVRDDGSLSYGGAQAFAQTEFGGTLARDKSGDVLIEAYQEHEVIAGFADADARINIDGAIHAGSMVIEADAEAVSELTSKRMLHALNGGAAWGNDEDPRTLEEFAIEHDDPAGNYHQQVFTNELQETFAFVLDMGMVMFREAKAEADVVIDSNADLIAVGNDGSIDISAQAQRRAAIGGFQSFMYGYFGRMGTDKVVQLAGKGVFGLGATYSGNHGFTRAIVQQGARVHSRRGDVMVQAESVNSLGATSFVTTVEKDSIGALTVALGLGDVETTARIDWGVDLHAADDLVVDALSTNSSAVSSVAVAFGQSRLGAAFAVQHFKSDTDAYLGSSVGHLAPADLPDGHTYQRTGSVQVSALTEVEGNTTYAKTGIGTGAVFGNVFRGAMAFQNEMKRTNSRTPKSGFGYNMREERIAQMYNKVWRGAGAVSVAITEQESNAKVADWVSLGRLAYDDEGTVDTVRTAALDGTATVRGATILTRKGALKTLAKAGIGAGSEHSLPKSDGSSASSSSVNTLSGALVVGDHRLAGTADIGSNVKIAARRVGVTGSSEAEWEPTLDDGFSGTGDAYADFQSGLNGVLGKMTTSGGLTGGLFTSWASTSGSAAADDREDGYSADAGAVGASVNAFMLENEARAWVDDGARIYAKADDADARGWRVEWASGNRARTSHTDWESSVDIRVRAAAETLNGGGQVVSPSFWAQGADGGVGLGLTGIGIDVDQTAIAGIDDGAVVDAREVSVDSRIREWHITLAASGAKSNNSLDENNELHEGIQALGTVSIIALDSAAHATVANTATIRTGELDVRAVDDKEWVWNVPAAAVWGGSMGFGATFGVNDIGSDTVAAIAPNQGGDDPTAADESEPDAGYGQGTITADAVRVDARNRGEVGGLALAGAVSAAQSDSGADETFSNRMVSSTKRGQGTAKNYGHWKLDRLWRNVLGFFNPREKGAMYSKSGHRTNPDRNIAGAGAVIINNSNLNALARIEDVTIRDRADVAPGGAGLNKNDNGLRVSVNALGETNLIALSGAAALALGAKKNLRWAGSDPEPAGSSKQIAVAGAVAGNWTMNDHKAEIVDSHLVDVAQTEVVAVDASEQVAIGLAAGVTNASDEAWDKSADSMGVSVSSSVSISRIDNRTRSRLKRTRVEAVKGDAGPAECDEDERCDRFVNVLAQDASRIFSGGFGLSVANKGDIAAGGSVTVNHVSNVVDARIEDAHLERDGDEKTVADSLDDVAVVAYSNSKIIGVGANGSFKVGETKQDSAAKARGAGTGTFVMNVVDNVVRAVVTGDSVIAATDTVTVSAQGSDYKPHVAASPDIGSDDLWSLSSVKSDDRAGDALTGDGDVNKLVGDDAVDGKSVAFDPNGDGAVVVGVAGGLALSTKTGSSGGVAIVANDVSNEYIASVADGVTIEDAGRRDDDPDDASTFDNNRLGLAVDASDRAQILGIAAGMAASWKSSGSMKSGSTNAGVGSIVINRNTSDVVARVDRSVVNAAAMDVQASADGRLWGAAGQLAISNGKAGFGLGLVVNVIEDSETGAQAIDGSTLAHGVVARTHDSTIDLDGSVTDERPWVARVNARSDDATIAVTAGIAAADKMAAAGSSAVNVVDRTTRAEVRSGNQHAFNAASLDVSALHATPEGNGFMLAFVLSGAWGKSGTGFGAGITVNHYAPTIAAKIDGVALSVTDDLQVRARSQTDLFSIATSMAVGKNLGLAFALGTNVLDSTVSAELVGNDTSPLTLDGTRDTPTAEDFDSDVAGERAGDYSDLRVHVSARDDNRALAGAIGAGAATSTDKDGIAAGGGASIAVNSINGSVDARVADLTLAGEALPDGQTNELSRARIEDLVVSARSSNDLDAFSVAVGVGKSLGLAGAASANELGQSVTARITDSTIVAEDDIAVLARANDDAAAGSGALGVGFKGVGIALGAVANVTDSSTRAYIRDSDVTALALDTADSEGDDAMRPARARGLEDGGAADDLFNGVKDGDLPSDVEAPDLRAAAASGSNNGRPAIEGLAVTAKREQETLGVLAGASVGTATRVKDVKQGWAATALFTAADDQGSTDAFIENSSINANGPAAAGSEQTVHVDAVSDINRTAGVGGISVGMKGAVSVMLLTEKSHQNTRAWIDGGPVRARNAVTVKAHTDHWTRAYSVGVSTGSAALSGAINLAETNIVTRAYVLAPQTVETGTLTIGARTKADTLQAMGTLAAGGAAGGLGVNENATSIDTRAFLKGASVADPAQVSVRDALNVSADTDLVVRTHAISAGVAPNGAFGGSFNFNRIDSDTQAFISNTDVELGDSADLTVLAHSDSDYDLISGGLAASGDVGLGMAVGSLEGEIASRALLVNTRITGARNATPGRVAVSAERDIDIESYAIAAGVSSGSLGAAGSVAIIDLGGEPLTALSEEQMSPLNVASGKFSEATEGAHDDALSSATLQSGDADAVGEDAADPGVDLTHDAVHAGIHRSDDVTRTVSARQLSIDATDRLRLKSIAGGFGVGTFASAGVGVSIAATNLSGDVTVHLEGVDARVDEAVIRAVRADGVDGEEAVETLGIAGAAAGAGAFTVGVNHAQLSGDVTATVRDAALRPLTDAAPDRSVRVHATDSSRVKAENVTVSASLGGAIAAGEVRARKGGDSGQEPNEVAVRVLQSDMAGTDTDQDGEIDRFYTAVDVGASNEGAVFAKGISAAVGSASARGNGVYATDRTSVVASAQGGTWALGGQTVPADEFGDVKLRAWSHPSVAALAAGGSIAYSAAVGVSLAQARISGDVSAWMGVDVEHARSVTVEAGRGEAGSVGAWSWAVAADAALLGAANGAEAFTQEQGDIEAVLDGAVTVVGDGDGRGLTVRSLRDTGLVSRSTGVVAGGVALGGSVSETRADGRTTASIGGNVVSGGDVDVRADNASRTYAHAESGSGGAVAVGVADTTLKARQDAAVEVDAAARITSLGDIRIHADADTRFRAGSDAYQAALAGGGAGAVMSAEITPSATVTVGDGVRIVGPGVDIGADSHTRFAARDDLFGDPSLHSESIKRIDNVINTGAGAGLLGVGVSRPEVTVTPESIVTIGDDTLIKAGRDDLLIASHGTADVRMTGWTVAVGGLAGVPAIEGSLEIVDALHKVVIGERSTLYAEDMLGVSSMARDMTLSLDNTARAGGVVAAATANSDVSFDGAERISIGADSRLHAYGDLYVTSGRRADRLGTLETSDINVTALTYAYLFGIPAEDPTSVDADVHLSASMTQAAGSRLIAGRDVAVGAFRGELRQYEYEEAHYLGKRESEEGSPTPHASWLTQIDGSVTAGYYSDWTVTTRDDPSDPFDIRLNGNALNVGWRHEDPRSYLDYDPDFDARGYMQDLKAALQADPDGDYQATIDYLNGLDLPQSVPTYTVKGITATQGNVTVGGTMLRGTGTVTANRAEIGISSDIAGAWLRVENLRVLDHDGGRIRLANDAFNLGAVELREDGIGDDGIADPAIIRVSLGTGYSGVDGFDPDQQPALLVTGWNRQYGLQNQQGIVSLHNAGGNIYTTTGISADRFEIRAPGGAYVQIDPNIAQHLGGNPWASWKSPFDPDLQCGSAADDRGMVTGACSFSSGVFGLWRVFDRMLTGGVIPADYVVALAMKDFLKDKYEDDQVGSLAPFGINIHNDWQEYVGDNENWLTEELIKQRRVGDGRWVSYTPYNLNGNEFEEWSRSIGPDEYYPEGAYKYIDTRHKDSIWRHVPNFDMDYTLDVNAADFSGRAASSFHVNDVRILADVININSEIDAGFSRDVVIDLDKSLFDAALQGPAIINDWSSNQVQRLGVAWVWRHADPDISAADYNQLARAGQLDMGWHLTVDKDRLPSDPQRVIHAEYDMHSKTLEFGRIQPGKAGSVFLDGKIISTNPGGRISASNGLGDVRIEQTWSELGSWVSDIVVNEIATGSGGGEVEIIDRLTNSHTLYRNAREAGAQGTRVYRTDDVANPSGWESVADWNKLVANGLATTDWTDDAQFAPKEGVGYAWRRAYAVHRSIDDKGDNWFYNDEADPWEYGSDKEGQVADVYFMDPSELESSDSGHALVLNSGLTPDEDYRARVVRDRTAVRNWSTKLVNFSDSTMTDKFGSSAYFSAPTKIQVVTEETVRADHAIDIGFSGPAAPSVEILADAARVSLAGRIDNPLGDVTIKGHRGGTAGAAGVTAGSEALIRARGLEVRGDAGVGADGAALPIELHGGVLRAASYGDSDDARGVFVHAQQDTPLTVEFAATAGTPVNVSADAGIVARNRQDLGWTFNGSTVNLDGGHGQIVGEHFFRGMARTGFVQGAGIAASEGVSARVAGDGRIGLFASGGRDLRIGRIVTEGQVELAADGSILRGAMSNPLDGDAAPEGMLRDEARWQRDRVAGAAAVELREHHVAGFRRGVELDHVRYWRVSELVEADGDGGWRLRAAGDLERASIEGVYAHAAAQADQSVAAWLGEERLRAADDLRAYYGLEAGDSLADFLPERPVDLNDFRLDQLNADFVDPLTRNLVLDATDLYNAINAAAADPDSGSASWLAQGADVRGSNVTLHAGGNIGSREDYRIQVTDGEQVSAEQRARLLDAAPGSAVIVENDDGYRVDLQRVDFLRLDATGQTRVDAGGMVALADRGDLDLAWLVANGVHDASDVYVSAEHSILDDSAGAQPTIVGNDGQVSLRAIRGSIGQSGSDALDLADWNPIGLDLGADGALIAAIAGEGVYLNERGGGLDIGMITAGQRGAGEVILEVADGSLRQVQDREYAIRADNLQLRVDGSVGAVDAPVRLALTTAGNQPGVVSGDVGGSAWLSAPEHALALGEWREGGDWLDVQGDLVATAGAGIFMPRLDSTGDVALTSAGGEIVLGAARSEWYAAGTLDIRQSGADVVFRDDVHTGGSIDIDTIGRLRVDAGYNGHTYVHAAGGLIELNASELSMQAGTSITTNAAAAPGSITGTFGGDVRLANVHARGTGLDIRAGGAISQVAGDASPIRSAGDLYLESGGGFGINLPRIVAAGGVTLRSATNLLAREVVSGADQTLAANGGFLKFTQLEAGGDVDTYSVGSTLANGLANCSGDGCAAYAIDAGGTIELNAPYASIDLYSARFDDLFRAEAGGDLDIAGDLKNIDRFGLVRLGSGGAVALDGVIDHPDGTVEISGRGSFGEATGGAVELGPEALVRARHIKVRGGSTVGTEANPFRVEHSAGGRLWIKAVDDIHVQAPNGTLTPDWVQSLAGDVHLSAAGNVTRAPGSHTDFWRTNVVADGDIGIEACDGVVDGCTGGGPIGSVNLGAIAASGFIDVTAAADVYLERYTDAQDWLGADGHLRIGVIESGGSITVDNPNPSGLIVGGRTTGSTWPSSLIAAGDIDLGAEAVHIDAPTDSARDTVIFEVDAGRDFAFGKIVAGAGRVAAHAGRRIDGTPVDGTPSGGGAAIDSAGQVFLTAGLKRAPDGGPLQVTEYDDTEEGETRGIDLDGTLRAADEVQLRSGGRIDVTDVLIDPEGDLGLPASPSGSGDEGPYGNGMLRMFAFTQMDFDNLWIEQGGVYLWALGSDEGFSRDLGFSDINGGDIVTNNEIIAIAGYSDQRGEIEQHAMTAMFRDEQDMQSVLEATSWWSTGGNHGSAESGARRHAGQFWVQDVYSGRVGAEVDCTSNLVADACDFYAAGFWNYWSDGEDSGNDAFHRAHDQAGFRAYYDMRDSQEAFDHMDQIELLDNGEWRWTQHQDI